MGVNRLIMTAFVSIMMSSLLSIGCGRGVRTTESEGNTLPCFCLSLMDWLIIPAAHAEPLHNVDKKGSISGLYQWPCSGEGGDRGLSGSVSTSRKEWIFEQPSGYRLRSHRSYPPGEPTKGDSNDITSQLAMRMRPFVLAWLITCCSEVKRLGVKSKKGGESLTRTVCRRVLVIRSKRGSIWDRRVIMGFYERQPVVGRIEWMACRKHCWVLNRVIWYNEIVTACGILTVHVLELICSRRVRHQMGETDTDLIIILQTQIPFSLIQRKKLWFCQKD